MRDFRIPTPYICAYVIKHIKFLLVYLLTKEIIPTFVADKRNKH